MIQKKTNIPTKKVVSNIAKLKSLLDNEEHESLSNLSRELIRGVYLEKIMKEKKIIEKKVDGLWHFDGRFKVNFKNVEKLREAASQLSKTKAAERKSKSKVKKTKQTETDSHADLAEEISKMVEAAVKKELGPLVTAMQCSQRHLDVIATKINLDLS